jgi:hypothetical protein
MMYFHLIATHILIASISSILICITTLILQVKDLIEIKTNILNFNIFLDNYRWIFF